MPRQTSFLLKTRVSPPADAEGQALNGGLEAERPEFLFYKRKLYLIIMGSYVFFFSEISN